MRNGLALTGYESARFTTNNGGTTANGHGRLVLVTGRITGSRMTVSVPGDGQVPVTSINSITYARLAHPTKPGTTYTVLSAGSNRASVRRAARTDATVTASIQPAAVLSLVQAATRLTARGRGTTNSVPVLRYRLAIRTRRLARPDPVRVLLHADGASTVMLDVSVDGRGRPVRARYTGSGATVTVTYGAFNRPVSLSPPPQEEVDTGS